MHHNPLIVPILDMLKRSESAIKEYDILQALDNGGEYFPFDSDSNEVALFKKHFMIMNALYNLQNDLVDEGFYVSISPLKICINSINDPSNNMSLTDDAELIMRDYYLDWSHFDNVDQNEVESLLSNFWKKYLAQDHLIDALSILGVSKTSDWDEIKTSYRRLVMECHPDKGGDQLRFIEIREAYEIVKRSYSI